MKKRTLVTVVALVMLAIWGIGIVNEYGRHCTLEPNPEYQQFVQQQKRRIKEFYEHVSSEPGIAINESSVRTPDDCFGSNFEGAEVRLAGIAFYDSIYRTRSEKPYYTYYCNGAILDPDHPVYGLPDIEILIGPVTYFEPEKRGIGKLLNLGSNNQPKPYRTYRKPLYDSLGLPVKMFEMQLWLTTFKVVITVISDRDKPQAQSSEASLNARIYPGKWYQSANPLVSMNDLRHKEEYKNHLYGDITFVLELKPDASPWYIVTDELHTRKPDMAIGAVICTELIKRPKDENEIHVQLQKGMMAPLYYKPFDSEENSPDVDSLLANLSRDLVRYNHFDIWNRSYFTKIYSKNIGSRQKGFLGLKKFDEQLEYTFLMPLFVVGSWDVQLPWELMPQMQAPKPYYRRFSLRNLLPDFNLGFGAFPAVLLLGSAIFFLLIARGVLFR